MKRNFLKIFLFFPFAFLAQQNIDSLRTAYKNLPKEHNPFVFDSARYEILGRLIVYAPEGEWEKYNAELKELVENDLKAIPEKHPLAKKYKDQLASILANMGNMYGNEYGNKEQALEYYHQSLKLIEETGNKISMAFLINDMAVMYGSANNPLKSKEYYEKCLKIFEEEGRTEDVAMVHCNLGVVLQRLGDSTAALNHFYKSLKLGAKDNIVMAYTSNNIGMYYCYHGDFKKGLEYITKSLKLWEKLNSKRGMSHSFYNMAKCYVMQKKYDEARDYANRALQMAQETKNPQYTLDAANLLIDINKQNNNYKSAFEMLQIADNARDSMNNTSLIKKQAQYQFEARELMLKEEQKQLEQLHVQKQKYFYWVFALCVLLFATSLYMIYSRLRLRKERENKKLMLQIKDAEIKALQAQMNPHFIFNSLNSVLEYIRRSEKDEAMKYLTKFSRLIRLVLETSGKSMVSLHHELELLQLYVDLEKLRFANNFTYKIVVDENLDIHNIEIPAMIIQPFVENAILHGLQNKQKLMQEKNESYNAKLSLEFIQEGKFLKCVIEDNGVGREKAKQIKEAKTLSHQSMGMRITEERLDLINRDNWKVTFIDLHENGVVSGTRVEILTPLVENI